jgi:hypothetical protein
LKKTQATFRGEGRNIQEEKKVLSSTVWFFGLSPYREPFLVLARTLCLAKNHFGTLFPKGVGLRMPSGIHPEAAQTYWSKSYVE